MADRNRYYGVNYNNLRKALYLLYFGVDEGKCNDFSSPKYKYIIPMQGNFDNPLQGIDANDTYIQYWIETDKSLTQDDYVIDDDNKGWNRQKCVATILLRFIGKEAEDWSKAFRHLAKRNGVTEIWSGVCNAERLECAFPIVPRRINFAGKNSQVAFDTRVKLYYDEVISTGWKPLTGIKFDIEGEITLEGEINNMEESL